VIIDPLAEERPAIYQRNLCITDSTAGLSSFVLPLLPLISAKSREIPRKFKRIAVQGHPGSVINSNFGSYLAPFLRYGELFG